MSEEGRWKDGDPTCRRNKGHDTTEVCKMKYESCLVILPGVNGNN